MLHFKVKQIVYHSSSGWIDLFNEISYLRPEIRFLFREFIDEFDMWPEDTTLWVEGESATVNLGEGDQKFPGEGRPAILFVHTDEDGDKEPDIDYIEDFASQWFDFRQA